MKKYVFVLFLTMFLALPVSGEVYRWTDSRGNVHFTDDSSLIPEPYRSKALETEVPPQDEAPKKTEEPSAQKGEPVAKDNLGKGEEYWKARIREWQQKQAKAQERLEHLRTQYNELTEKHNASKNSVVRATLLNERDQVKNQMEESKAQIDEAKRMLEKTIPEEAALFKANPQWLKP